MSNCGNIIIHCNRSINFDLYDFGISEPNKNIPYVFGGEYIVLFGGEKVVKFVGLVGGTYRWFVKDKLTGNTIKTGESIVNCSEGIGIKTFFFSNIFPDSEINYTFDITTKSIVLNQSHELFGRNFEILHSSFNGIVVRTVKSLSLPNLATFDDVVFSQNSFNISEQFMQDENLFSVTVKF
jgi:hypothetical protein